MLINFFTEVQLRARKDYGACQDGHLTLEIWSFLISMPFFYDSLIFSFIIFVVLSFLTNKSSVQLTTPKIVIPIQFELEVFYTGP